ncbi:MAG TPA: hypothetical protein DCQ98_02005 [Planctomycetaceae bacterium]|nr:hypothetical protein [Planctomycetaceae bacterium]
MPRGFRDARRREICEWRFHAVVKSFDRDPLRRASLERASRAPRSCRSVRGSPLLPRPAEFRTRQAERFDRLSLVQQEGNGVSAPSAPTSTGRKFEIDRSASDLDDFATNVCSRSSPEIPPE